MAKISAKKIGRIKYLRQQGWSIPEIAAAIPASKSTVCRYCRQVAILPEFLDQWSMKRGGSHKKRLQKEARALEEAKVLINSLTDKEKLLYISALYWAEGNKKDLILINSDPALVLTFLKGLRDIFHIPDDRIRANIRIHSNLNHDDCLNYWSKLLDIPASNFCKTEVVEGNKKGKLQYGMCRLRVKKGSDMLKTLVAVNKTIYELFLIKCTSNLPL